MTPDQIRTAMHTQPFRAFTVFLADGRTFLVRHPDFISLGPRGREVVIHDDDGMHLIDLGLVLSVCVPEPQAALGP